ncbi:MAG: hypothetical protein AAF726_14805 [Planctomycetota bacterium]
MNTIQTSLLWQGPVLLRQVPVVAALSFAIAACSSSSDDDGAPVGGGSGTGTRHHLYLSTSFSGGSVQLVDPRAPTSPTAVGGLGPFDFEFNPVLLGTPDASAATLRDVRVDRLVVGIGARVLELSLALGSSTPALRELITLGGNVEEIDLSVDLSGATPVVHYVVEVGPGTYETFTQTGAAVSPSVPFPGAPVVPTGDPTTAALTGWLALDAGMLTFVDLSLAVTDLRAAAAAAYVDVTDAGATFLSLPSGFACFRQDLTLVDVAFTPSAPGSFMIDQFAVVGRDALYFASPTGANSFEIVRALADGTAVAVTASVAGDPFYVNVTDDRVLYAFDDPGAGGQSLMSVDLLGGDPRALETGTAGLDLTRFSGPGIAASRIAYEVSGLGVVDVADDGSDREVYANAELIGTSFPDELSLSSSLGVAELLLLTPVGTGGWTFESVVPGDTASRRTIGALPQEFDDASATSFFTRTGLLTAIGGASSGMQTDVYWYDLERAGSLVRITNTLQVFEIGVL